jgi:hypothetical protein
MSAKALIIVAVTCLAGMSLGDSRSLARGGGGSHGGGTWGGHGGQMDGFSMHNSAMGRHDRGEQERLDQRHRHGLPDDRRDRFEHQHDHLFAHWGEHHWHRDHGFGEGGRDRRHPEGTWSRAAGFGDSRRGQTKADGEWHLESR